MSEVFVEVRRYQSLFAEGCSLAKALMNDDSADVLGGVMDALRLINKEKCVPPKDDGDLFQIAYRCIEVASKALGGEREAKEPVLQRLSQHFHIHEEVWGTHWSGRRLRIDAIITPKDDSDWKTKSPHFGVEFKNFRGFKASGDMKDYTKWWSQCHDYAETDFDEYGYVYVFSYNGFSHYRTRSKNETTAAFAQRFWGRVGVGELMPGVDGFPAKESLMLMLQGHKVWSEVAGVGCGKSWLMERKFGSR